MNVKRPFWVRVKGFVRLWKGTVLGVSIMVAGHAAGSLWAVLLGAVYLICDKLDQPNSLLDGNPTPPILGEEPRKETQR